MNSFSCSVNFMCRHFFVGSVVLLALGLKQKIHADGNSATWNNPNRGNNFNFSSFSLQFFAFLDDFFEQSFHLCQFDNFLLYEIPILILILKFPFTIDSHLHTYYIHSTYSNGIWICTRKLLFIMRFSSFPKMDQPWVQKGTRVHASTKNKMR